MLLSGAGTYEASITSISTRRASSARSGVYRRRRWTGREQIRSIFMTSAKARPHAPPTGGTPPGGTGSCQRWPASARTQSDTGRTPSDDDTSLGGPLKGESVSYGTKDHRRAPRRASPAPTPGSPSSSAARCAGLPPRTRPPATTSSSVPPSLPVPTVVPPTLGDPLSRTPQPWLVLARRQPQRRQCTAEIAFHSRWWEKALETPRVLPSMPRHRQIPTSQLEVVEQDKQRF